MAAVVATLVVGPLVKVVMEKASGTLLGQYKVMKGMEEQHEILKRKLPAILDIITDAEQAAADTEQAAARRAGVTSWLKDIKKVSYEANEVFDEFKYEALRRKAKKEGHYQELGFGVVMLFPTHNPFVFRQRIGRKLRKVVRDIEVLIAEMNTFHFECQQQPQVSSKWRQTNHDLFDPKKIINRSRAKDNKKIVDILIGQANNADLTVLPIVGLGGLGKTTLAQLVYNDSEIQNHFDVLIWVCVSNSFDVDSLARSIVEAAPGKTGTEAGTSKKMNTPLDILQNALSGKRYLLVLDDVWTREHHKWEKIKARLEHGGKGTVVLTTTRDRVVAEMMGTFETYTLKPLGGQYIKEIIEATAFSRFKKGEQRPAVLLNMVDEIVERCAGSPLAAIALGSILCNKTSEEEWKAISRRSSICTVESGILPILKLSYNDLPPHMQQCFAFCAIFPKDYKIDMDKLIQLWIAHGFVIQENQVRLETSGKQIFSELASRSFFQDVVSEIEYYGTCYSRTTCKIHDLMHDVALSVMEKECALATEDPCQSKLLLPNTARHLFLSCKDPERRLNSSLENSFSAIQTLLCDSFMSSPLKYLSKYGSLKALKLHSPRSFPLKPKHLHHLRYLDLSRSHVEALPEDMSILYNLQTLNLSCCSYLGRLPRQMKYMTALRHLYTHGCPKLKSMPTDLGKLKSLQTLTCFVAGSGSNCSNVGELRNLNLCGQLELCHLENVTEEDAEAANLVKKELGELTLKWTVRLDDSLEETSGKDDARVLDKLKSHDGLHAIRIHSYGATSFPTWMNMLQNIVEIHLFDCPRLQWLFSRDCDTSLAFSNLKELTLKGLVCLERWWEIGHGMQREEIMFPRLEKLFINHCELLALPGQQTFPNLQNVCIKECPIWMTRAKSPKLSVLNMDGFESELFPLVARHMTSLTNLELSSFDNITETIPVAAEHGLREVLDGMEKWNGHDFPLAVLALRNFNSGVIELCGCFVHLQDLSIVRYYGLVYWPEKEFEGLVYLSKLKIYDCVFLTGYVQSPAEPPASSQTRQLLPRLESLTIQGCGSLIEVFNHPASLRKMYISCCSSLESPFGRRLQPGQSAWSIHHGSSCIPEVSSSSPPVAGAGHLEVLKLDGCYNLTGILHLPTFLKEVHIGDCDGLTSVESCSGELPLLKRLGLWNCNVLSSLPDGPQSYLSLQRLFIRDCPGMKMLPTSLQQRLGSIQEEYIDAHYYGNTARPIPTLLKPKTWKYAIRQE